MCRGSVTRTRDRLVPNQERYQLRYTPIPAFLNTATARKPSLSFGKRVQRYDKSLNRPNILPTFFIQHPFFHLPTTYQGTRHCITQGKNAQHTQHTPAQPSTKATARKDILNALRGYPQRPARISSQNSQHTPPLQTTCSKTVIFQSTQALKTKEICKKALPNNYLFVTLHTKCAHT